MIAVLDLFSLRFDSSSLEKSHAGKLMLNLSLQLCPLKYCRILHMLLLVLRELETAVRAHSGARAIIARASVFHDLRFFG